MSTDQRTIIADSLADADPFARAILRLDLHNWQGEILYKASRPGRRHLFGDCPIWRDHDHLITTATGGRLSAWVTDEPKRFRVGDIR